MLLSLLFGINGIWYAVVVSEFLAFIFGVEFLAVKQKIWILILIVC